MRRGWGFLLAGVATLVAGAAHAQADPPAAEVQGVVPDQDPNFEIDSGLSGGWYSLSNTPGVPNTSGNQEQLSMAMTAPSGSAAWGARSTPI